MGRRAWIALATAALLHTFAAPGAAAPPMVTAVELSSSHPLPEQQVRAVIGIPVVTGLQFGHVENLLTLPFGATAHLVARPQGFTLRVSDYPHLA